VSDQRMEVDLESGEERRVAMTAGELAALAQRQADAAASAAALDAERATRRADAAIVRDGTKTMPERFAALVRLLKDRLDE
jgi:hypothetical protein